MSRGGRKIRMGMVGGGEGAFIGTVHRMAAELDGDIELVCGAFASEPERSRRSGELLYGLAPQRCYPDYPAMLESEGRGYSTDICSFHRIALGASHLDHFPEPEILVTTSFYCDGKAKTNEILSILHRKPAVLLQVPAAIDRDAIRYVEQQLREIAREVGEDETAPD